MNTNSITTENWSNHDSERLYRSNWPDEPEVAALYESGTQCGGCAFYAQFNADFGLCCHPESRHHLETVFEHFTCARCAGDDWSSHSFSSD